MNSPYKILFQTLVKPFYKENKGAFIFIFTMFFFIVSQQSDAGLYAYHYSLVTGMLSNWSFFYLFYLFGYYMHGNLWLLYQIY